ncbi:MAG TPA: hypothetical protein VHT48_02120 [Methylocella sp.]|nr:hypothetical protein [Methylocella sp.]
MIQIDRLLAALLWLLGVLSIAGITHIVAVFALPEIAAKDTFARISELAKPGRLTILPPSRPDKQVMPFGDPAMVQSVCPFDLSQGGLRLHADVEGGRLLTFSFRTSAGQVFYSMTDLAAQQGKIDVIVLTAAQLEIVEAEDDEADPSQDLRLVAPEPQGFVIVSALALDQGDRADAEKRIKSVVCAVEQVAQD